MGADRLTQRARERFVGINGEHPMTPADDAYVREHFVPAGADSLRLMADDLVPQASYLLSDGTPMVPPDHLRAVDWAGSVERVHDWFVAFWPDDAAAADAEWRTWLDGRQVDVRRTDPVTIRRRNLMVDQARAAVEVLRTHPRDHVARGSLGEALDGGEVVSGLDQLLLPMTGYDRLRLGGPTLRDTWVDAVRQEFFSPSPPDLPIRTERLLLRRARAEDWQVMHRAWADPDYVRYLLTGVQSAAETEQMLRRRAEPDEGPHRRLSLVIEHEGEPVGDVMVMLQGTGLQQAEIGWMVHPGHEGRGLATEASRAAMALAFEHYGVWRVVAYLDALNERSAAMAERLGMRREAHRIGDYWSKGRWTDTLEYALLAPEWQARRDRSPRDSPPPSVPD